MTATELCYQVMTISIIENSNCSSTHDLGIVTGALLHCCWVLHTPLVAQEAVKLCSSSTAVAYAISTKR